MKLRDLAKKVECGSYTLSVIDECCGVIDILVENGTFDDVVTVEKWFDYSLLRKSEYLVNVLNNTDGVYYQTMEKDGGSNWTKII